MKENHITTPVYSEEEFADLLGSAEWRPVSNGRNPHEAGSTASNAREGLSECFYSSISLLVAITPESRIGITSLLSNRRCHLPFTIRDIFN